MRKSRGIAGILLALAALARIEGPPALPPAFAPSDYRGHPAHPT
jgi:hypothetical protein